MRGRYSRSVELLFALIGLILLVLGIREERQWAAILRQLQRDGVQVRATEVQIRTTGRRVRTDDVVYRFLTVRDQETTRPPFSDPATLPRDPMQFSKFPDAVVQWHKRTTTRPSPWVWGSHRLSSSVREAVTLRDDRTVTYLPDAPAFNAIGAITDERISREWRSNPLFVFAAAFLLTAVAVFVISWLMTRPKTHHKAATMSYESED
jgi:hypothetical protein